MAKKKAKAKQESKDVQTGSLGIGDAFAYGIGSLIQKMKDSGSNKAEWLGVPKQSLEAKDCVDREKLTTKGKK